MIQTVCDRCKKVIVSGNVIKLKQRSNFIDVPNTDFHLCFKCHDDFERFLANKT